MISKFRELKLNVDAVLAIAFIVTAVIPYFSYIGRGDVLPYMMFAFWLVAVMANTNMFIKLLAALNLRSMELWFLFAFMIVALLNYLFVTPTTKAFQFTIMPVTYMLLIVMDTYYFLRPPAYKLTIFFVVLVILGIQAAVSVPYVFGADETISRMYTSGELEGAELEDVVKHGIGSANFYANLAGVFFLGIGAITKYRDRFLRLVIYGCLGLILVSLVSSSYSVAFWLLGLGILVLLLKADWKKIKSAHILIVLIAIVGLIMFYSFYLADSPVFEPIQRKFNLIQEGNLRDDGRIDLAEKSLNTFLKNPLLGIGVPEWGRELEVGEHSPWFDFPAHYGIIGFMPFLLFIFVLLKRNFRFYFTPVRKNVYSTVCLIGFLVFIVSNLIDPTIFEPPMIITFIFFYTSVNNWGIVRINNIVKVNEARLIHK